MGVGVEAVNDGFHHVIGQALTSDEAANDRPALCLEQLDASVHLIARATEAIEHSVNVLNDLHKSP